MSYGPTLWAITPAEEADIHAGLFAGLENGTLRPIVDKELPIATALDADIYAAPFHVQGTVDPLHPNFRGQPSADNEERAINSNT